VSFAIVGLLSKVVSMQAALMRQDELANPLR
jgi:hypothetical protein